MGLFQTIQDEAKKRKLSFLVVGGLAVNVYGIERETADLDLLILRDAREQWLELLSALGYTIFFDGGNFIQLAAPANESWPVDLMLVREATFTPMLMDGRKIEMYGVQLLIPSLEHLMALKLHALAHRRAGFRLKDFVDMEGLIRANKIDLRAEKMRALFLKYGNLALYEKLAQACSDE